MSEESLTTGSADGQSTAARQSARRARITARAALSFQEHGYAATSMQQIADAVGLSKASLYYYVGSKDDLLFAMLQEVNLAGEAIVAEVTRMPVSPLERLAAYLRAWVHFNVAHIAEVTVFSRDLDQLDRRRRLSLQAGRDRRFDFVTELVRTAQAEGDVSPEIDPESVSRVTLGMVGYMHTWYRSRQRAGAAELGDLMASMVMGGLGRRDR